MDHVTSKRSAKRVAPGRAVVIHANEGWLARLQDEKIDAVHKIATRATREGYQVLTVAAGSKAAAVLDARPHDDAHGDLRLILGGATGLATNTLHLHPGPIWGFWYLDELGIGGQSSIRFAQFCAELVDYDKAKYFFDGVTGYMLRENISQSPQEVRMHAPLRGAKAVIFCQDIEAQSPRTHYLTNEEMIRTVAEHDRDARIYVKLHPAQSRSSRRALMDVTQDYPNVKLSEASIHDLIEAADLVVTQTSTTGFEALMQKCPVITCGKTEYWQATLTAHTAADLREALEFGAEAMAAFPYEKYFYWFLGLRLLEPAKDKFAARAWARLRDKAFL
ncbi:hypothetical protein [Aliiroseovarius subalbicans]|uniref:capsular polysaccharide export protein, LipB/KpsS family n=1 Tax=Aliiroseovarius subalbicans TaxID=2925840 RepID=UPI001F5844F9|nr:hypothetical protein [Aliiroseovarius subalbicans]MCI2399377.1 hypothetical protein [Aliiroseovarius subalbicans]